ncbi:MAG: hypothetical protein Q4G35_05485 [Propionibacteriaceae bacterium]|nr:hypothetical protein [Propionibacteriaceae bacterium]
MNAVARLIAEAIGPRIGGLMQGRRLVVVQAPRQYNPALAAEAGLRHLSGDEGFGKVVLPGPDADQVIPILVARKNLLIELDLEQPVILADQYSSLEELIPPTVPGTVVIAVPHHNYFEDFPVGQDLTIDSRDLVIRVDECDHLNLNNCRESLQWLLQESGGVPELLAAALAGGPEAPGELLAAASRWAEECIEAVEANEILQLATWAGWIQPRSLARIAGGLAGRRVSEAEVNRELTAPAVTVVPYPVPGIPRALSTVLRAKLELRDPEGTAHLRRHLVRLAAEDRELPALERVRLLTSLREWGALDELLATRMHLLILLSKDQVASYATEWADHTSGRLRHLEHAHRYVAGMADGVFAQPDTPQEWVELAFLLRGLEISEGSFMDKVRSWLERVLTVTKLNDAESALGRLDEAMAFFRGEAARVRAEDTGPSTDALAFAAGLLIGLADAALLMGAFHHALSAGRFLNQVLRVIGDDLPAYGDLLPAVELRQALISAKTGLPVVAEKWLTAYEAQGVTFTHLADFHAMASRAMIGDVNELLADVRIRVPDPEDVMAPQSAESEALRMALVYGPKVAADWVRATLNRAAWSARGKWGWWPLTAVLVLLEARIGRADEARALLESSWLPESYDLAVAANVEYAAGNHAAAEGLADQALAHVELPQSWRFYAVAAKWGSVIARDGMSPEAQAAIGREPWRLNLGAVALTPDVVRELIVAGLDGSVEELPGLGS